MSRRRAQRYGTILCSVLWVVQEAEWSTIVVDDQLQELCRSGFDLRRSDSSATCPGLLVAKHCDRPVERGGVKARLI
jgi:hypothetical protein